MSGMFGLGIWELLLILLIILLLFSRKLPELGSGLPKSVRNFRRPLKEPDEIDITPKEEKKGKKITAVGCGAARRAYASSAETTRYPKLCGDETFVFTKTIENGTVSSG